jgi:hypothetical protein
MGISNPQVFNLTLPLMVLERCPTPAHLSTWVAIYWLWLCFRDQRLDDALIARRARVSEDAVPRLVAELIALGLLRGNPTTGEYVPAWMTLQLESARAAESTIAAWAQAFPAPPVVVQERFCLLDDDDESDAEGTP